MYEKKNSKSTFRKIYILRIVANGQFEFSSIISKKLHYVKEKVTRTIKDDYESLVIHLFKQYGRALAFIIDRDGLNFNAMLEHVKGSMFENPKYKIFDETLFSVA